MILYFTLNKIWSTFGPIVNFSSSILSSWYLPLLQPIHQTILVDIVLIMWLWVTSLFSRTGQCTISPTMDIKDLVYLDLISVFCPFLTWCNDLLPIVSGSDGGVGWKTEGRVVFRGGGRETRSGDRSDNVRVCHSRLSCHAKRATLSLTLNTHPDKWRGAGRTHF